VRRAAAARGEEIAEFFEEKRSGASRQRPELTRLRQAVRAGEVTRVYVFRLDRLTRLGIRDTIELLDEFRGAGAEVVTVADGFDAAHLLYSAGPAGEIVVAIIAWAAKMELHGKRERISAARERIEGEGGRWGRPRKIDPTTLAAAKKLVNVDKLSVRVAAQRLKVKKTTLLRALHEKGHYARKKDG
jgi:DNA invertase Pin-like site-specific DNA recombinase